MSAQPQFKKDFKRVSKQIGAERLGRLLKGALDYLLEDRPLPAKYQDHELTNLNGTRDCHLRPDLILLYAKAGDDVLRLIRVGSHSDLF